MSLRLIVWVIYLYSPIRGSLQCPTEGRLDKTARQRFYTSVRSGGPAHTAISRGVGATYSTVLHRVIENRSQELARQRFRKVS
eukprot:3763627-Prymnesium_polylepis.1